MAKFTNLSFCQIMYILAPNLFMQMFNVSILCGAKYQFVSFKGVVRVDWPVYALFMHTSITLFKSKQEKMDKNSKLSFYQ